MAVQSKNAAGTGLLRLRAVVRGAVQGVGFRPFVYRLAAELALPGWVNNNSQGVFIEVEGTREQLDTFRARLERERPPRSFIQSLEASFLDPAGFTTFEIRESESGPKTALILPDIATCPDCLAEVFDASNRRYRYPFTNCTNCGPRFSIIEALPYDRPNTSMRKFPMCAACRAEYDNPLDRRFHAQPNACPDCGPHLELWDGVGEVLAARDTALLAAAQAIVDGQIVALKGIGGFQLLVDARNQPAIERLRQLKHREEKPFAVMFPSLEAIRDACQVSAVEERLLTSPETPIVLLRARAECGIAPGVAPRNRNLGCMLPYSPLHHLLMVELGFPVVATSGNLSDEPICTDERDALVRLRGMADIFLVHDRPIVRHVDDSVVRILGGRELVMRRARGYAPLPVTLAQEMPPTLAVGAHLKNAVALAVGKQAFISQHIGDLETPQAYEAFERVIGSFRAMYEAEPATVVRDLHPDYLSSQFAEKQAARTLAVQHHLAHVLSCMAENELESPVLGVSWDGTGLGTDGTIWGGEFLRVTDAGWERVAHLRTFRLPGGDKAVKEPRRTALGALHEFRGAEVLLYDLPPLASFSDAELRTLSGMLERGVNAPLTSGAGRLFDAVAAILGLRQSVAFEGQAAMELEFAAEDSETAEAYPFEMRERGSAAPMVLDWAPMLAELLRDVDAGVPTSDAARKFHNTLVEMIVAVAQWAGDRCVALSGGCFQNRLLTERAIARLGEAGFRPYWHQRVPPNDGGIALGQLAFAARVWTKQKEGIS